MVSINDATNMEELSRQFKAWTPWWLMVNLIFYGDLVMYHLL